MPESFRHGGPRIKRHLLASLLCAGLLAAPALAAFAASKTDTKSADKAEAVKSLNSDLDAPLFYQLLVGELELRAGQPGVAYQVLLDAARRTSDEELFTRVVSIALQARAGDQALLAAKAWREALPKSAAAQQMTIQLLALLNRPAEVAEPLRSLLALTPEAQRPSVLVSLPRLFQRAAEPKKVLGALDPVLEAAAAQQQTRLAARVTQARFAIQAGEHARALTIAKDIAQQYPESDEPMQLALELMPSQAAAEELIQARLTATPANHALRLAYGQALARAQRAGDAAREFRAITEAAPSVSTAWFALGALELDLRHSREAESALNQYLQLLDKAAAAPGGAEATVPAQAQADSEARQQAWLMLAQAAEMRGDFKAAEAWLIKVDGAERVTEAQFRRASLLARQGRLSDARKVVQAMAEDTPEKLRGKLLAESQLLRDMREWQLAYEVLAKANERLPDDADMLYEQSMMAEKLGRFDEMEALLRKVIAIKPDHHHAYNALGYSLAERNIRLDEARTLIAKALSFVPNEPFILDSMGWVEFRLGNKAEAVRLLRQSYASRPDAEIAAHLGEALWVNGEQDEARRIWQEGIKRDAKNEALQETLKRLKVGL